MEQRMKSKQQLERSIRRHKTAVLLVNTHSRNGQRLFSHAKRQLEAHGYSFVKTYAIDNPRQMERTITKAMALKPELLIVGSGDGTLSTVVDHLAYTDTVLGYLPLGTTNNFGRSLGIRPALDYAIQIIVGGKVADVDLGRVNGDYFGNMASMGVSVGVAAAVPRKLKRRIGRLAYALYSLKAVALHKPFIVKVRTDKGEYSFMTHQFCVANGRMHSGKLIAADASVDNKTLIAYALGGASRLSTAKAAIYHARSSHKKSYDKGLLTVNSCTVKTLPPQSIDIDGEVKNGPEDGIYRFDIAADALKVFVPDDFPDN